MKIGIVQSNVQHEYTVSTILQKFKLRKMLYQKLKLFPYKHFFFTLKLLATVSARLQKLQVRCMSKTSSYVHVCAFMNLTPDDYL